MSWARQGARRDATCDEEWGLWGLSWPSTAPRGPARRRSTRVPFARDARYYKEFPVMFDWLHNTEGLNVFCMQGLSVPQDSRLRQRARRYAGFYLNEDPGAPNYDAKHRIIRSMFNGSR